MARAQKHTRTETRTVTEEVTTYTLELSREEADYLRETMAAIQAPYGHADRICRALVQPEKAATDPTPLAVGDRVRVLREYRESDGDVARPGTYSITDTCNGEPEFLAKRDGYGVHLLPADGEGTIWERAS